MILINKIITAFNIHSYFNNQKLNKTLQTQIWFKHNHNKINYFKSCFLKLLRIKFQLQINLKGILFNLVIKNPKTFKATHFLTT